MTDPVLVGAATTTTSTGLTTTSATGNLASTTVGDINVLVLNVAAGTNLTDPGVPTINGTAMSTTNGGTAGGWTTIGTSYDSGSPGVRLSVIYRVFQSGDASSITWGWAVAGNHAAGAVAYQNGTFNSTTPIPTSSSNIQTQAASSTAFPTPTSITSTRGLLIAVPSNRTGGTWTAPTGDTIRTSAFSTSSANFAITDSGAAVDAGTYSKSATFSAATSVGNVAFFLIASTGGGGGGTSTLAHDWVVNHAAHDQYVAHRDGQWTTFGEETMEGYTSSAAYHSQVALEISVYDTSDGVWVASHDSTTGRVFTGTNRTITSTTWATFSPNGDFVTTGRPTTLVGGHPMRRLEEILDAFPNRVFVIDNKHNLNHTALIGVLEAHASGRWIAKQYYTGYAWLNAASQYAPAVWAYFYPADLTNMSSTLTNLSTTVSNGKQVIYGLGDYSLGGSAPVQSDATTFFTFTNANSIKTWAHILSSSVQRTTADSQSPSGGFDGYMISNVEAVLPTDSTDPMIRAVAATTLAFSSTTATANLASATTGDLNILVLVTQGPSGAATDPGVPSINGVAVSTTSGITNAAGWTTVFTDADTSATTSMPRLTVIARIRQAGDTGSTVTWTWPVTGDYVTGGVGIVAGTFNGHSIGAAIPVAVENPQTSGTTFVTPTLVTTKRGLIFTVGANRTVGTWTAPTGDAIRTSAYQTSSVNFFIADSATDTSVNTFNGTKTATFSVSTTVGLIGAFSVASVSPTTIRYVRVGGVATAIANRMRRASGIAYPITHWASSGGTAV